MAGEDDDKTQKSDGEPRRSRTRRTRTPVTIDLKAEPTPPEPAADAKGSAADKKAAPEKAVGTPATAAAKPEPAKSEPAKDAAAPAKAEATKAEPPKSAPPAEPPKAESTAKPPPPPPPPPPPRSDPPPRGNRPPGASAIGSDDGWMGPALFGVAGGVAAFILLLVLQGIGLVPAPGRSAANQATEAAKAASEAVAGLERRMSAVEMMTQDLPPKSAVETIEGRLAALEKGQASFATQDDVDALAEKVAGAQTSGVTKEQFDALSLKLSGLGGKIDVLLRGINAGDLADLKDRVAKLEIGGGFGGDTVDASAVQALSGRIDAVQQSIRTIGERLATLETQAGKDDDASAAAAKAIAVMTLRRAAGGDAPFLTDLTLAAALGLAADDVAALKPLAEKGAPTVATLAARFPAVGDAILKATNAPDPNAGFLDRLFASIGGLVTVRPAGPMTGDDPQAIVSRMRAEVDAGNLDAALKEREALPEAGKAASAEWAADAADRAEIDTLVEKIAASVTGAPPT